MWKNVALGALVLLDDLVPKTESRAEKYITDRVPMLSVVDDEFEPVIPKPRKPTRKLRKKHVCEYGRSDLWACFILGFISGGFVLYIITHI